MDPSSQHQPVGPRDQQVMSPRAPRAILSGEVDGPNYGTLAGTGAEHAARGGGAAVGLPNGVDSSENQGPTRRTRSLGEFAPTRGSQAFATGQLAGNVGGSGFITSTGPAEETASGATVHEGTTQVSPHTHTPAATAVEQPAAPAFNSISSFVPEPPPEPPRDEAPGIHRSEPQAGVGPHVARGSSQRQTGSSSSPAVPEQVPAPEYAGVDVGFRLGNPFSPGTPPPPVPTEFRETEVGHHGGMWAFRTRISEVLHRRVLNPVLEHVQGVTNRAQEHGEGNPWTRPQPSTPSPQLISPEVQRSMQVWTNQASLISPRPRAARDDSSSGSIPQELIMEEVRRQVQMALEGRDAEMKNLKAENEGLRKALQATSQVLEEVAGQPEGGGSAQTREASSGLPERDAVSGGKPGGEGWSAALPQDAPPGIYGHVGGPRGTPLEGHPRMEGREALRGDRGGLTGAEEASGSVGRKGINSGGPGPLTSGKSVDSVATNAEAMQLLVQGMRQLQQLQITRKEGPESEAIKGGVELQAMPQITGDSAVEFADWLYVAEQTIGGLTDSASMWYSLTLRCARRAYEKYQGATSLERLTIVPILEPELQEAKWSRLDRRVLTLLLNAMTVTAREDAVTHRVSNVASALYRLHILYQPGGSSERAAILRQLEGASAGEDPNEAVTALRKWCRYLERAEESGISPPDASVLLRGVEIIIGKTVERHHDVRFRLSLVKNDLQLQNRPSRESVMKYVNNALAELQQISPPRKSTTTNSEPPRIKALGAQAGTGEATTTPSPSPKNGRTQASSTSAKTPCKFFASDSGCRRGSACQYGHDFASREDKKSRCWTCGSKGHRQGDCPTKEGKGNKSRPTPGTGATPKAAALQGNVLQPAEGGEQAPYVAPSTTASSSAEVPQVPEVSQEPDLKSLLQEANAMLKKLGHLSALRMPKLMREVRKYEEKIDEGQLALLDSGATHAFRQGSPQELDQATVVHVQLADGQIVALKQNPAGTLMPIPMSSEDESPAVIIPLGALVEQLGCKLQWTRHHGLRLEHPRHGVLTTYISGGCPMVAETQALDLIAELEEKQIQELEEKTAQGCAKLCEME